MTLTIDFTPQLEAWINSEAQQRGLQPGDLIRRMIEEQIVAAPQHSKYKTPQERIQAMDAVAKKNAELPILPDSAFDRENIYEDSL
jgi:negative regulator of replication initiation